jgi:hypothetical protein
MKRILIKAYNNSEYITDTDFVILNLSDENRQQIKDIQNRLKKHFPDVFAEVHLYNQDFEVYSDDMTVDSYSKEILNWINSKQEEYTILTKDFNYDDIPNSETINDIRLDTYILKVYSNTIRCVCYPKYDGNVEVFSEEININEL